jgi:hypothetical protein
MARSAEGRALGQEDDLRRRRRQRSVSPTSKTVLQSLQAMGDRQRPKAPNIGVEVHAVEQRLQRAGAVLHQQHSQRDGGTI